MSFTQFANVGSECGPTSSLSNLISHFGKDRRAQQDRLYEHQTTGEASKLTFRSPSTYAHNSKHLTNEFFELQDYDRISSLNNSHFQSMQQQHPMIQEDWSRDFMSYRQSSHTFDDFEYIYQSHNGKSPSLAAEQPWCDEFSIYQHQQVASSEVSEEEQLAFERAFEEIVDDGGINTVDWDKEFADHTLRESQMQQYERNVQMRHSMIENSSIENNLDTVNDTQQSLKTQENDKQSVHLEEEVEERQWHRLEPHGKQYGYRAIHTEHQTYECVENNPYLTRFDAIDGVEHTVLADAILALEAKVQIDPTDAKAWEQLGLKQQENERDAAAITALEKAVSLQPTHCLDAWLALAVSYTNEHCRMDAYNCLEQWISNTPQYKYILQDQPLGLHHGDAKKRHIYITDLYLEAARSRPGEEMDADVQVGLGVLFNMSEEYGKAIDCFKSALVSRPNDYQLWNKVGATLANSRDSTGAIEMYFNALQINPSFVRARYNVAISCMNLGQYKEAAEHLLTALALQRAASLSAGKASCAVEQGEPLHIPNGTSAGIWDSLRLLMYMMSREDLAAQCNHHNLDAFYGQFDF